MPTTIRRDDRRTAAGRKRQTGRVLNRIPRQVVTVFNFENEQLPFLFHLTNPAAVTRLKVFGKQPRCLGDIVLQFLEPNPISRVTIQERRRGPTPRVGRQSQVIRLLLIHDLAQKLPATSRQFVLQQFDTTPVWDLFPVFRKIADGQLPTFPGMSPQEFRHPFAIPWRAAATQREVHETMHAFMQDKMAAVIIARLFIGPEFAAPLVTVQERWQVGRQEPGLFEFFFRLNQIAN